MDAALLGLANESLAMVQERAAQPPPGGYRYPAFAQHYQEFVEEALRVQRATPMLTHSNPPTAATSHRLTTTPT